MTPQLRVRDKWTWTLHDLCCMRRTYDLGPIEEVSISFKGNPKTTLTISHSELKSAEKSSDITRLIADKLNATRKLSGAS